MGFYYLSIFSLILILVIYAVGIGLFRLVWVRILHRRFTGTIVWLVIAMILIAPWAEELWIAWNFGQACKEAGTFIHKKVKVDGFYDSTMRSAYENTRRGGYRFVEQATADRKGVERVERAGDEARTKALDWYAERNPGKSLPKGQSVIYPLNGNQRIVVFPKSNETWLVTRLAQPTARYHYRMANSHTPVAHKIVKHKAIVVDSSTGDLLGKYTRFSRRSPWFYLSFGRGDFSCDAPGRWPLIRGSFSIYRDVLQPADWK